MQSKNNFILLLTNNHLRFDDAVDKISHYYVLSSTISLLHYHLTFNNVTTTCQ